MNDAGRIGFVIRGNYINTDTYDFLDVVYHDGASYVAKKLTTGNEPQESNEYWQILAKSNTATNMSDAVVVFEQAETRANIKSGEDAKTLLGKIKKWYSDLKPVAFTGTYGDLTGKPTIPAAVAVKGNNESTYRTGNVNLTPDNIGAVELSRILTTMEQIEANTDVSNVAGAAAIKSLKSDFANSIDQINSNLSDIFRNGEVTKQGTFDLFTAPWQGAVLLIGWLVATGAGMPTACIVVGGSGHNAAISEISNNTGTSVQFQIAEDGQTIQFVNPYGNVCFWCAILLN